MPKPIKHLLLVVIAGSIVYLIISRPLQGHGKRYAFFEASYLTSAFDLLTLGAFSAESKLQVVLCTTFTDSPERHRMHWLVIRNYALLGPRTKAVLYYSNVNASLNVIAKHYGWDVRPIPRMTKHGTPYIRDIFQDAFRRYDASYYAYANGDILFSDKLLPTLDLLDLHFSEKIREQKARIFLVGRRSDLEMDDATPESIAYPENINALAQTKPLYIGGEDYFIMKRDTFPWNTSHNMLIGRPGIDNYLMQTALNNCLDTVDVTYTLRVLHLKGVRGTLTSFTMERHDFQENLKLLTRNFDWTMAQTANAAYETYSDDAGETRVRLRSYITSVLDMPDTIRKWYIERHGPESHHSVRCNKTYRPDT